MQRTREASTERLPGAGASQRQTRHPERRNVHRDGTNLTVVTDSTRTIINWDKFGVPGGSTTHFAQPGANAATLNRVQGSFPTHINEVLSSKGAKMLRVDLEAVASPIGMNTGAMGIFTPSGIPTAPWAQRRAFLWLPCKS